MIITVILINYHSETDLLEAVGSLKESNIPKGFERKIVVVDNDRPSTLKDIPGVEILRPEKNLGFTGGNNLGIKKNLNSDFFLLLNPDTVVDKNFIVELLKSNAGLASPKIYFAKGYETHPERYKKEDLGRVIWYGGGIIDWNNVVGSHIDVDVVDVGADLRVRPTDFCTGCCMLISREAMDKLKGFDDKYFLNLEDLDLSVRAQKAGFKTVYVPKAIIWHKNAVSKGGTGSKVEDYWQTRNRLIFAFRYATTKVKFLLLWQLLRTANLNRLKAILSACF